MTSRSPADPVPRTWTLVGADGRRTQSDTRGTVGGHARQRLYGRLDCPSALAALRRSATYARHRVFFADEATAISAGYRPCARCLPERYAVWRAGPSAAPPGAYPWTRLPRPPRHDAGAGGG